MTAGTGANPFTLQQFRGVSASGDAFRKGGPR